MTQSHKLLEEWSNRYNGLLQKVARAFSTSDRADLLQEMLLQLWRSIPQFKGHCKESTWVYRVAFYTALQWNRKNRCHRTEPLDEGQLAATASPEDPRLEQIYRAIRQLKTIDRTLVLLALEQHSYQEISEITGLTVSNVGVRLKRAKDSLLERVKGESLE